MRLKQLVFGFMLFTCILLVFGCEPPPTHILYITDFSCIARDAAGNIIDPLWLFPGDRVVWVNSSNREVTVKFEDERAFGMEEWTIASGRREIVYVKAEEEMAVDYIITPCEDPPGTPKAIFPPPPP